MWVSRLLVNKPGSVQSISMWSTDLFGPTAREILGQDGCQDNNSDTRSLSFSNQLHNDTTLMHVRCVINPDWFSDAVRLFHRTEMWFLTWLTDAAFLWCRVSALLTFEVSFTKPQAKNTNNQLTEGLYVPVMLLCLHESRCGATWITV